MKSLVDPGKDKPEKGAKAERIKALVAPLEGDMVDGKKVTKAARKKVKDSLRTTREAGWRATL